jgi:hypothetical protein
MALKNLNWDGFDPYEQFHKKMSQRSYQRLAKTEEDGYIIEGYSDNPWSKFGNDFQHSSRAFLFSFLGHSFSHP